METGKFWFIIIFVSLVAGIFTGVQHFQGVDAANAQVIETKSKLSQLKDTLVARQDEWAKVSVLASKAQQAVSKEAPLTVKRDELKTHVRRLEGDFKYMVKSVKEAVEKIRAAGVGVEFPEVKLTNGKILNAAKIKKLEPMNISFIHADGFTIVSYDELPEDIRERFDMGGNGLAEQLAAAEQTIQTANYSGVKSSGKPFKPSKDHIGVSGLQTIQGLTINCPVPLNSAPSPAEVAGLVRIQVFGGSEPAKEIDVALTVMDAPVGKKPDIDVALKGAIEGMIRTGVSKHSQSTLDLTITGFPAKRSSFSGISQGQPVSVESLGIARNERLYLIQIAFSNKDPKNRDTVSAILSSVTVE